MPERLRVVRELAAHWTVRCASNRRIISPPWRLTDQERRRLESLDDVYVQLVQEVNWSRVLLRAAVYHETDHDEDGEDQEHMEFRREPAGVRVEALPAVAVCGACVEKALLDKDDLD